MTAWMEPGVLLVTGAVAAALDRGAVGAGAWGAGIDRGLTSGSESVSMLSHFE